MNFQKIELKNTTFKLGLQGLGLAHMAPSPNQMALSPSHMAPRSRPRHGTC